MPIPHPYRSLSPNGIRKLFLWTLFPVLAVMLVLRSLGAPLVNDAAPMGIISYELAADFQASSVILESWSASDRISAELSLGFDFLFLVLYALCISAACAFVAEKLKSRSARIADIGSVIAWAVLAAAVLDAIENVALICLLNGSDNNFLPLLSRWSAIPKFLFVVIGLMYVLFGGLYQLVRKSPLLLWILVLLVGCSLPASVQDESPFVVVFGSCIDQSFDAPIMEVIAAEEPDVFLMTGDNIYSDSEDPEIMATNYAIQGTNPEIRRLFESSEVLGTWDDHDYGASDAGREHPIRREAQRMFADFFRLPESSPVRARDGVYDSRFFEFNGRTIQIILLDTRFFRGPLTRRDPNREYEFSGRYVVSDDSSVPLLGEAQWTWLESQLRQEADMRLVISSIQFVAEEHGWEKWANLPHERSRFLKLVRDTRADGLIILSGDRHLSEISVLDKNEPGGIGYPLYDITSSGLNKSQGGADDEPNSRRFSDGNYRYNNFGRLSIFLSGDAPRVRVEIVDEGGESVMEHTIELSDLRSDR